MTTNDEPTATGKPSLAVRIDEQKSHPLAWKAVLKRAALAAVEAALAKLFPQPNKN